MQVTILGKRWELTFARMGARFEGHCDHPERAGKQIRIDRRLKGQRKLEIVLHECLHAALWSIDEQYVDDTARDLARVLWRLGYRDDPDKET